VELLFESREWLSKRLREASFKGLSPINCLICNQLPGMIRGASGTEAAGAAKDGYPEPIATSVISSILARLAPSQELGDGSRGIPCQAAS
jgi:hypothetical protein